MAPSTPTGSPGEMSKIPTAKEVTSMGGVWAATSAKRDKLGEIRVAMLGTHDSLDDAATEEQKLDLYLAEGMNEIVKAAEKEATESEAMKEFLEWLDSDENDLPEDLAQVQFETLLTSTASKIDSTFNGIPKDRYVKDVRDFMVEPDNEDGFDTFLAATENGDTLTAFQTCVLRYRLHMVKAAAEHLKQNWAKLVTLTNGDTDRAAVKGESVEPKAATLSRDAVKAVLVEFAKGNCSTRFDALWNLVDRDQDGLLDEPEVTHVANFSVVPVGLTMKAFLEEAIAARPIRQAIDADEEDKTKPGFWARRREASQTKRLKKFMDSSVKRQFEDELEMPHRLRIIYAWANKAHQDNRIDRVHIDTGLGGRKRFVELAPKMSLPEFREVQKEHFAQLDKISEEMIKSFREELWMQQGSARESTELQWNTLYFMGAVCVIDIGIYFV